VTRILTPLIFLIALVAASPLAGVQEHEASEAAASEEHGGSQSEIDIMHHLANARVIEVPYWKPPYSYPVPLPQFAPIHIGPVTLDLSLTKHSVFLMAAATLVALVFILSARAVARAQKAGKPARGFAGAMEAMVLFIRQEVILPNVGAHGEGFVPYLLTVFFFILVCNLLGLLPWGATATGNIAVTAAMAFVSLVVIEVSGMRALGLKGYLGTIFYLPPGLPVWIRPAMLVIMTPVEIIGKLAKPFALAVRLFANMTAGHVALLAIIGLTFAFGSWAVGVSASALAVGIMMLELFVAFLQAFVFTLLTAVFIGLMRAEH
jgi:F-type H+-transporting ATPase subunit a